MSLDQKTIQAALDSAKIHGFRKVHLVQGDASFSATFSQVEDLHDLDHEEEIVAELITTNPSGVAEIHADLVGYYQDTGALVIDAEVEKEQSVAKISALGLSNDVISLVSGRVVEVFVTDGEPVQFGQLLAKIKINGAIE